VDDLARILGGAEARLLEREAPEGAAERPSSRPLRILVGITGASGAVFAVDFLRRCPGEKFLIASKWARAVLKSEVGLTESDLDPFVHARFPDSDLAAPFSSGSNPFDAYVIVPCSASTAAKIAAGIGDTLITRAAQVALKERRRLVLAVRETPLSTAVLGALHALSRDGAVVFPLSPGWYGSPRSLEELVARTTDKLLRLVGVAVPGGWREEDLE
jgi:4-hydroxy-3-polyprenylbenzoate decarboxylase